MIIVALFDASRQPSFAEFVLVDCPHRALDILHAHEAFVQREIVSNGILESKRW